MILILIKLLYCGVSASLTNDPSPVASNVLEDYDRHPDDFGIPIRVDEGLNGTELVLVHVMFRHGDRTPDREELELYPDDPNIDHTFFPWGLKALTNKGKERSYRVGEFLRARYGGLGLLSRLYLPEQIRTRTTDYDRTKMTALAALAGLYPPERLQQWSDTLNWQPVPYDTIPYEEDDMMYYYTCPRYLEARREELAKPYFQNKLAKYGGLFKELSAYTGRDISTPEDVFYLDNLFQAEKNVDIEPPVWAQRLMGEIQKITRIEFELEFYTTEMIKLSGGPLLYTIVESLLAASRGTLQPRGRRALLYSAHENNVAALMAAARVLYPSRPHQPPYGATFAIELRRDTRTGEYGVVALYLRDVDSPPVYVTIDGCGGDECGGDECGGDECGEGEVEGGGEDGVWCPLDKFVKLTQEHVATREEMQRACNDTRQQK